MHDEMLEAEGVTGGALAGALNQLTSQKDYFEEFLDLCAENDSITVGNDVQDDGASDVADLFTGVEEVTERKIRQVSATVANAEDVSPEVVEWLEEHEGEEVFVVHW